MHGGWATDKDVAAGSQQNMSVYQLDCFDQLIAIVGSIDFESKLHTGGRMANVNIKCQVDIDTSETTTNWWHGLG